VARIAGGCVSALHMVRELRNRGIFVSMMVPVPLHYKGEPLNKDYVIDILVEDEIILELKARGDNGCS
jgi:GxxExxY protein